MIYFDNSATTKIFPQALDTYVKVSDQYYGNPSSIHQKGEEAQRLLQQSRKQIATLMGTDDDEIYFTSGGTEGDNWAIRGTAYKKINQGRHLITTTIEHSAVKQTMKSLEARGWEVTYIDVDDQGQVSPQAIEEAIRPTTVLVSVIAVNNEVGSVQPIKAIGEMLKTYPGIHFHVDAVQAVGKIDLDLSEASRIDIAAFSGHKFHAPRGVGFTYLKKGRQLSPLMTGGGQEDRQRSGTENIPAIAAMAKSLRLLLENVERKRQKMATITSQIRKHIESYKHGTVFTPENSAPHILCFGIVGIKGEVTLHAFEKENIYLSTTSACSSRSNTGSSTLQAMKVDSSIAQSAVRLSLSEWNTEEEGQEFIRVFDKVYNQVEGIL